MIHTGITQIDEVFSRSNNLFCEIIAMPMAGLTTLLSQIAYLNRHSHKIVYMSTDETAESFLARLCSLHLYYSKGKFIQSGELFEQEDKFLSLLKEAQVEFANIDLVETDTLSESILLQHRDLIESRTRGGNKRVLVLIDSVHALVNLRFAIHNALKRFDVIYGKQLAKHINEAMFEKKAIDPAEDADSLLTSHLYVYPSIRRIDILRGGRDGVYVELHPGVCVTEARIEDEHS